MRKLSIIQLITVSALLCAGVAQAEPVPVYSTGFDSMGAQLQDGTQAGNPDANWFLVSAPDGTPVPLVYGITTTAPASWIAPDTASGWIGPVGAGTDAPVGFYTYQTSFDLTSFDPATFALTGRFASDNEITDVLINGFSLGSFGAPPALSVDTFQTWTNFSIDQTNAAGDFVQGVNTVQFILDNDPNDGMPDPSGFRAEIQSATADPAPEPGTLVLLGSALLGIGVARRRRTQTY